MYYIAKIKAGFLQPAVLHKKCTRRDSNPRHVAPETTALSPELLVQQKLLYNGTPKTASTFLNMFRKLCKNSTNFSPVIDRKPTMR